MHVRLPARHRAGLQRAALADSLRAAREQATDSPVFRLLNGLPAPALDRFETDVFREQVDYSTRLQEQLATARAQGANAVHDVRESLGDLRDVKSGVLVDVLLSLRAVEAHQDMVDLVDAMPEVLRRTTSDQEQYAFALNRLGRGEEAERVLLRLIAERGASSATYGLLGRVYKDRWQAAQEQGQRSSRARPARPRGRGL